MSRAAQIISILEGFKLGSLGVSHKPKVTLLDEPEFGGRVKVVGSKWLEIGEKHKRCLAAVTWKESNGYTFVMAIYTEDEDAYDLQLVAGLRQTMPVVMDDDLEVNSDFKVRQKISFLKDKQAAITFIKKLFQMTEQAGSFGEALLSGKLGSNWKVFENGFDEYLGSETEAKSPYFKKA
jgi:hypothetical protein